MMEPEVLTLEAAAALARCGVDCLRQYIDAGEIPAARLNQKHMVLLREDVIDFIRVLGRKQAEERRKPKLQRARLRRSPKPDLDRYGTP